MNHIIPIRNERSTWWLYAPLRLSPITSWNQPKNIVASSSAPGMNAQPPAQSFRNATAPAITRNSDTDPTIGQWLPWGT